MSMRISEQSFRQLLDDPQASKAVFALDRQWCAREGVSFAKPEFGLAELEFIAHLCVVYLGEVFNGGHEQFFSNSAGRYWRETAQALERVGLPQVGRVFREACSVFPNADIPLDQDEREQVIDEMSATQLHVWNRLDRSLFGLDASDSIWDILRDYLRRNGDKILVTERGLVVS